MSPFSAVIVKHEWHVAWGKKMIEGEKYTLIFFNET